MSFLATLDTQLHIVEIKWSDPIYLVTLEHRHFIDLVVDEDKMLLQEELKKNHANTFFTERQFSFIDYPEKIRLCVHHAGEDLVVFGWTYADCITEEMLDALKRFIVNTKARCSFEAVSTNDSVRFQFEKIQQLNNELVNTKRLLEKANIQLKKTNSLLHNRLVNDALTGLVSKYQYPEEMKQAIALYPDRYGIFAFIDIDDFKSVNDTYGHSAGDEYLIEFAKRLKAIPFENMICMRIAGDEFGLFVYGLSAVDSSYAGSLWEAIKRTVLMEPIKINEKLLAVSISVGMAVYGKDTENIFELIDLADQAMYLAKKSGKDQMRLYAFPTKKSEEGID